MPQRENSIAGNPSSSLRLEWQGYSLDTLRDLRLRVIQLTNRGEHESARITFLEALDGLEALVGRSHLSTIETLSSFVEFYLSQDFYDEASDRLIKSLAKYQAHFAEDHLEILHSMARLGRFLKLREQYGNSEILLVRAKIGLEKLCSSDAEESFLNTNDIVKHLVDIFLRRGNFDQTEQEHLSLEYKLKALGEPYQQHLWKLQNSLLHLYSERVVRSSKAWHETEDKTFPNRSVPIQKSEQLFRGHRLL
jgi:glutaredoxin-related protein